MIRLLLIIMLSYKIKKVKAINFLNIKTSLGTVFLLAVPAHYASAATTGDITGLSTQVVFAITIIVGIIFGLILTRVAAENRQAKGKMFSTKVKGHGELNPNEILNELQGLSGSARSQKKAAMAISNLLEEKVDEKTTIVKQ